MDPKTNKDRLLRAIRALQQIQRTNPPKSSLFKAAAKALIPLLDEAAVLPEELTLTPAPTEQAS